MVLQVGLFAAVGAHPDVGRLVRGRGGVVVVLLGRRRGGGGGCSFTALNPTKHRL